MNDTETSHRLIWTYDVEDVGAGIIRNVAAVTLQAPWWGDWMIVGCTRIILDDLTADTLPDVFARLEDDLLNRNDIPRRTVETTYHPDFTNLFATARVKALQAVGELSPAAADMDPAEVLWQYAETNALDGADRAAALAFTPHARPAPAASGLRVAAHPDGHEEHHESGREGCC